MAAAAVGPCNPGTMPLPERLTQTQPFATPARNDQLDMLKRDEGVVRARLVSLTHPGCQYLLRDQTELEIGRSPNCEIRVTDGRVSARHLRIYRDQEFRYFVEELGSNGCFINEHFMKKGETRALRHGDAISICVYAHAIGEGDLKPFAAYIFRVASHEAVAADAADTAGSSHVTEHWVQQHWDIGPRLGSGNFSEVCLGIEVRGGQRRAVKIIKKKTFQEFRGKRGSRLGLGSEAEVLTSLKHPGIVQFYSWFETDAHLYLVMELVAGGDLLQCIMAGGCFAEAQACRLFCRLCEAVAYLHSRSIVHRDLKPDNVLLTTKDRGTMHPKIADFGLARQNMQTRDCRTFCGTPHYFAPEVIASCRGAELGRVGDAVGYGKKVDVWSLGVVLYILLSGTPPFEEEGLYEQILRGSFEFDAGEWETVSSEAQGLVRWFMTVEARDRPGVHEALEHAWLRRLRATSPPPGAVPPSPPGPCSASVPAEGTGTISAGGRTEEDHPVAEGHAAKRCRTDDAPAPPLHA
mmetsp:Transcript_70945/g.200241  ORF Transcript_70945/g.200241 Transcript_70945/m.200241 type:complete len:521 (-) Transcript_70945:118-1680(-)